MTIFLTPDGYHRLHMPCDAEVTEVRWIGRRLRFGSTVVVAAPKDMLEETCPEPGAEVRVGQRLG